MAEIVGVKVQLDGGEAVKTVGTLRQQLKASLTDLQNIQAEFGDISPQAIEAAKAVAGLRDSIKDANEVATLFDPEKTFESFVNVAQGVASGFAAAQGAMALLGADTKEVEAALLKVQSAMALAQGLSGIKAATEDFKRLIAVLANMSIVQKANAAANTLAAGTMRLFGVATTQTGVAFNFLKGAIIATGIGALVVLVGTLVQKMMSLASATDEAAEAQRGYNKAMEDFANEATDAFAEIVEQEKKLEIARIKARGGTAAEILAIERKANDMIETERKKNYDLQVIRGQNATEAQKALNKTKTDNEIFELGEQEKARTAAETKAKADGEKALADAKQRAEQRAQVQKSLGETFKSALEAQDQADKDADALKRQQDADYVAYQNEIITAQIESKKKQSEEDKKIAEENAAANKEIAERKAAAQVMAAQSVANALNNFAALAGEQTVAGKAFAVTAATIQAILGAQQSFTALSAIPVVGPALGAVAAAGAIAAGIANVKKILSVQVPGKGSGGAGANLPSMSGTAPLAPQRPQIPTTRIDQESINNMGAAPLRAYVVESDISKKQARRERIEAAAKFE